MGYDGTTHFMQARRHHLWLSEELLRARGARRAALPRHIVLGR